ALSAGYGRSKRYSTTVATDMLYVAVPYERDGARGVVRVARALSDVDAAVHRLHVLLVAVSLIGLVVAVIMSGLASHLMSRTLRQLAYSARAISRGAGDDGGAARTRIDVTTSDELGKLAGSLNRMADDIEATVSTLASERARLEAVREG